MFALHTLSPAPQALVPRHPVTGNVAENSSPYSTIPSFSQLLTHVWCIFAHTAPYPVPTDQDFPSPVVSNLDNFIKSSLDWKNPRCSLYRDRTNILIEASLAQRDPPQSFPHGRYPTLKLDVGLLSSAARLAHPCLDDTNIRPQDTTLATQECRAQAHTHSRVKATSTEAATVVQCDTGPLGGTVLSTSSTA